MREQVVPAGVCDEAATGEAGRETDRGTSRETATRAASLSWLALTVVTLGVPLVVALVVLRQPRWYPGMDLALTELLVRDVGTLDTPRIGLIGRFHALGRRGSHPGPLSFGALWPFYKAFGSSAWALQAAAAALNLVAGGLALWVAQRRGGVRGVAIAAAVLAVLARAYGADKLTEAWNPHIPLLWWIVFLLAVWSVLCDDLVLLPVVVVAGSLCAQTHVSYVALCGGLGVLVLVHLVRRGRSDEAGRRGMARWAGVALGLLVLLWLPPLVEEVTGDPGNLSVLVSNFAHPDEDTAGWKAAGDMWISYLDVPELLADHDVDQVWALRGSRVPGVVLLAAWAASAVVAWRLRDREPELARLHVVVAVALVCALVALSRILGLLVYWVVLWMWGVTALVLLAIAWTVAVAWRHRPPDLAAGSRWATVGATAGAAALVLVLGTESVRFTVDAAHVRSEGEGNPLLAPVSDLAPETVARLRAGDVPGGGATGRYELRWPAGGMATADAAGYALFLELDRQGLDVRTPVVRGRDEIPYGWADAGSPPPTAIVGFAPDEAEIERWEQEPDAVRIADHDGPDGPAAVFVLPAPTAPA